MRVVPYALVVGSLMYAMLCTRIDICFVVGMAMRYHSNLGPPHWVVVKHILKYVRRMRDYMLVYHCEDLTPTDYRDSDFQSEPDSRKSNSSYVFSIGGRAISWISVK
jgi:hypothetical protein